MNIEETAERYARQNDLSRHNGRRSVLFGLLGGGALYLGYNIDSQPLMIAGFAGLIASIAFLDGADRALSQQESEINGAAEVIALRLEHIKIEQPDNQLQL